MKIKISLITILILVSLTANIAFAYNIEGIKNDQNIETTASKIEADIKSKMDQNHDAIVRPFGVDPHCYKGPNHHPCSYKEYKDDCGCVDTVFSCCCGKTMIIRREWCSKHGY